MTKSPNQAANIHFELGSLKNIILSIASCRLMVKVPEPARPSSSWRVPSPKLRGFFVVLKVLLRGLPLAHFSSPLLPLLLLPSLSLPRSFCF